MLTTTNPYQQLITSYTTAHGYTDSAPRYQPCRVTLTLLQPYAGYDLPHLDGLLSSVVVTQALQGARLPKDNTLYTIPLPLEVLWRDSAGTPLFHASSLFPDPRHSKHVFSWTKKNDEVASRFAERKRDGALWQPDSGSGQFKEYRMPLPITASAHFTGYAYGDTEEIARLLSLLHTTGKKGAWGFGRIARVEVEPCGKPGRYVFVQGGRLLRPVPAAALPVLGLVAEGTPVLIGYSPPYWLPAKQAQCYPEGTAVREAVSAAKPVVMPRWSVPSFLLYCQQQDALRRHGDLILLHDKFQRGKGEGALCALTGLPITDGGAVAARDALSSNMGNVVDFCKAPQSPWVSNAAAIILSQPKSMHRNLVALLSPQGEGHLLWPTIALDPKQPEAVRPLWREVLLVLHERYMGYQCVVIYKDEPKSRTWPRARIGVVGASMPIHFSDSTFGISNLLVVDIETVVEQMSFIESLLDGGYGKTQIRLGLRAPSIERLARTLQAEKRLAAMRITAEFPLAWSAARTTEDRTLRKGVQPDVD
jgi:CRISPR type IV-associated protein Csf3